MPIVPVRALSAAAPGRLARLVLSAVLALLGLAGLTVGPVAGPAAAASPSPSPVAPANPGGGPTANPNAVTFGVQPATPNKAGIISPDSRPFLYYAAAPGSTITDHVAILNYSLKPVTLSVYTTDALNDDKGGFTLLKGSQAPKDAGSWSTIGTKRISVTIPARRTAANGSSTYSYQVVPFTVKVPATATPGDHVAGVLASLVSGSTNEQGANVKLDQRVGTRMFIRVAGPLDPRITLEDVQASYSGTLNPLGKGAAAVTFTVANRGNVKLGGRITVAVSGLLGRESSVRLDDLPLLLPGNAITITAQVPDVAPQGRNSATVTLIPLKLQGDSDPGLPDVVATTSFLAVPWTAVASVLALLLLGWFLLNRRRGGAAPAAQVATTTQPTVPAS